MKKIFLITFWGVGLIGGFMACTKLDNKDYTTIVSSQFNPGAADVAALVGVPYTNWRTLELGRRANAIWRTNEISADETVIPERPNGWVDGGIYRRMHTHTWTPDEDNCYKIWTNAYAGIPNCNRLLYQLDANLIPLTTGKAH